MKPTPKQVAEARRQLSAFLHDRDNVVGPSFGGRDEDAIRILLAATEPPTDEELMAEATSYHVGRGGQYITLLEARIYAAGARREGRR